MPLVPGFLEHHVLDRHETVAAVGPRLVDEDFGPEGVELRVLDERPFDEVLTHAADARLVCALVEQFVPGGERDVEVVERRGCQLYIGEAAVVRCGDPGRPGRDDRGRAERNDGDRQAAGSASRPVWMSIRVGIYILP